MEKTEYRDWTLVKGTGTEHESWSFFSSEWSSDERDSKLQLGSGSTTMLCTFCGQRGANLKAPLKNYQSSTKRDKEIQNFEAQNQDIVN